MKKMNLAVWVIKLTGIVALLYAIHTSDWHFFVVSVFIAILVVISERYQISKHLLLSLSFVAFFGLLLAKGYVSTAFIGTFVMSVIYIVFSCLFSLYRRLRKS